MAVLSCSAHFVDLRKTNDKKMKLIVAMMLAVVAFSVAAHRAPDFDMECRNGDKYSLDSLRTPLTLLYFTNIECDVCEEAGDSIASSMVVNSAIDGGRLTVLSVYVGSDRMGWMSREPHRQWKECINRTMSVYEMTGYDFSYLPAFYLIDGGHEIIASPEYVSDVEKLLSGAVNL